LNSSALPIEKKHRGLFTDLSLKARAGLDDELDTLALQTLRQFRPLLRKQHHAAVRYRHTVPIDEIEVTRQSSGTAEIGIQMADELMAVEIEIHPMGIAAALRASQQIPVESTRLGDIPDLYGDVEGRQRLLTHSIDHNIHIRPLGESRAAGQHG
jgi:hypothetical protein